MIVSTKAIVIRKFNYQETSLIIEAFTESDGLVSLIAKGARQNKKSLGVLEPLNIIFLSFYKKTTKDLFILSKYETISSYYKLLSSFNRLIYGLMIAEFILKTQIPGIPNEKLYNKTITTIENLKETTLNPLTLLIDFAHSLFSDLGFQLNLTSIPSRYPNEKEIPIDLERGTISKSSVGENIFWLSSEAFATLTMPTKIDDSKMRLHSFQIEKEIVTFFEAYLSFHLEKKIHINSFNLLI